MPRIVSRQWIETATATQVDIEGQPVGYGYQWWVHEPFGFAMVYLGLDEKDETLDFLEQASRSATPT